MYKKLSHLYTAFKKNPFFDVRMVRWATRLLSFQIDGRWERGYSFMPYLIHIMPTRLCNLRCKSCGQYGSTGFYQNAPVDGSEHSLKTEVFKSFIDQVSRFQPTIFLTGGEPFLHKDIIELISHVKSRNLVCWVVSNGVQIERFAEDIVDAGVDVLYISIDGPDVEHDKIRGMKGCFKKIEEEIRQIKGLKAKRSKARPLICQIFTLSNHSFRNLGTLPEITEAIGVDMLVIKHSYFTLSEVGGEYEKVMRKHFDCEAPSWKGWVRDTLEMDIDYIQRHLTDIQNRENRFLLSFFPDIKVADIHNYYSDDPGLFYPVRTNGAISRGTFSKKAMRCIAPWTHLMVYPNGDAMFCNDNPDYIVGNINNESFDQIWNNERAKRFRRFIKNHTLPICSRCCGLYYHPFFRSASSLKGLY